MRSKGLRHERILHSRMSDSFVLSNRHVLMDVSISITYSNNQRGEEAAACGGRSRSERHWDGQDEFLLRCESKCGTWKEWDRYAPFVFSDLLIQISISLRLISMSHSWCELKWESGRWVVEGVGSRGCVWFEWMRTDKEGGRLRSFVLGEKLLVRTGIAGRMCPTPTHSHRSPYRGNSLGD